MKISVIIPTYNRAATIGPAVESVFAQTFTDWELVIVDDGSKDNTEEVLKKYGSTLRYVMQANAGPAAARNNGARQAAGEWLAFLDSDDTWRSDKLERQLRFVEEVGADVCFHDLRFVRVETGAVIESWNEHLAKDRGRARQATGIMQDPGGLLASGGDLMFTSTLMMRTSVFRGAGGFAPDMPPCEDIDLYLRLAPRVKFGFVAEAMAIRGWGSNWNGEKTYRMRIEAMRRAWKSGVSSGNRKWARTAKRGMARELKCLAGYRRSDHRFGAAAVAYMRWLMATMGA